MTWDMKPAVAYIKLIKIIPTCSLYKYTDWVELGLLPIHFRFQKNRDWVPTVCFLSSGKSDMTRRQPTSMAGLPQQPMVKSTIETAFGTIDPSSYLYLQKFGLTLIISCIIVKCLLQIEWDSLVPSSPQRTGIRIQYPTTFSCWRHIVQIGLLSECRSINANKMHFYGEMYCQNGWFSQLIVSCSNKQFVSLPNAKLVSPKARLREVRVGLFSQH